MTKLSHNLQQHLLRWNGIHLIKLNGLQTEIYAHTKYKDDDHFHNATIVEGLQNQIGSHHINIYVYRADTPGGKQLAEVVDGKHRISGLPYYECLWIDQSTSQTGFLYSQLYQHQIKLP